MRRSFRSSMATPWMCSGRVRSGRSGYVSRASMRRNRTNRSATSRRDRHACSCSTSARELKDVMSIDTVDSSPESWFQEAMRVSSSSKPDWRVTTSRIRLTRRSRVLKQRRVGRDEGSGRPAHPNLVARRFRPLLLRNKTAVRTRWCSTATRQAAFITHHLARTITVGAVREHSIPSRRHRPQASGLRATAFGANRN